MNETEALSAAVRTLRAAAEPFVVATVVRVRGSAYRRPGARLVIAPSGRFVGSISGGCLERDLVTRGFFRTEQAAVVVTYDSSSDEGVREGFGLGCDGTVEVLLERGAAIPDPTDPFLCFERSLATERTSVLATVFRSARPEIVVGARLLLHDSGERAVSGFGVVPEIVNELVQSASQAGARTSVAEHDGLHVLIEPARPPPHLFVFGTGHDAVPLVHLARAAGLRATVCDHEDRLSTRERFGQDARILAGTTEAAVSALDATHRAAAVVLGHHFDRDAVALGALWRSRARYIGVLGPRVRTLRLLAACGLDPGALDRLHAPIGLRLGGESPEEVALAIVAEVQQVLAGATGGHQKDHPGPIHG